MIAKQVGDNLRVAVGGLWHETNTFAATRTRLADFEAWQYAEGADVLTDHSGVRDEVGGFIQAADVEGVELVPSLYAAAVPSGLVERAAFDTLATRLLARIDPAVDGVLLALHGAMVVDGIDDAEAWLVELVRERIGTTAPIVATLDFHANISERLFAAADVLIGYDTYPHTDAYERGVEAVEVLAGMVRGGVRPARAFRKVPLTIAPPGQATASEPMSRVMAVVHAREDEGVLTATFAGGFCFADVPWLGCTAVAYSYDGQAAADTAAAAIADAAWAARAEFAVPALPVEAAVRAARTAPRGPVVLVDAADNIGGGAPGDGTVILAELLAQGARGAVVPIVDPDVAAACAAAGVGGTVRVSVGGKTDGRHGPPVPIEGVVRCLSDGRYVHEGSYMTGQSADRGATAVVDVGGLDLVVSARRMMPFDAAQLRSVGIEPGECGVIVVKSAIAWRAAYGDIAAAVIDVDTPGVCTSNLRTLPYVQAKRPLVPLDDE